MGSDERLTLIIESDPTARLSLWSVPHDAESAEFMRHAIRLAEDRGVQGRCATCAFRHGTPANTSKLVAGLIALCLADRSGNAFICHEPSKNDERICAGYAALAEEARRA